MTDFDELDTAEVLDFEAQKKREAEEREKSAHRKRQKVLRARRRPEERRQAKRNGHKLGHGNRKCKRCGAAKAFALTANCKKAK